MQESLEFFKCLYARSCEGHIIFCEKSGHGFRRLKIIPVTDLEQAAAYSMSRTDLYFKFNVFDGNAVRARDNSGIGLSSELLTVVTYAIDIDCFTKNPKYPHLETVLEELVFMDPQPSMIVGSDGRNGGVHAYWTLKQPRKINNDFSLYQRKARAWYKQINERLGGHVDATFGLERILRPVGSLRKSGKRVELLWIR